MPTFSNIDGEESATVTFTVAAVSLTRNSSAELQEILSIGDPDVASSLGVARVTASAPASTNAGLNVRIVGGPSSVADFSVRAVLPSTYGDHGLRVLQSTAADLNVTVAGYSTTVNISSLSGPVIARSSAANFLASVYQSTAADLNVTVAGYSTTVNVSSLGGAVIARSSAANFLASVYQSTAADLNVTVAGYSTTVNVSSLSGPVIVRSSAADQLVTAYQSTYTDLNGLMRLADRDASTATAAILNALQPASTAYGLVVRMPAPFADSTNTAIRVNVVAGSAAGDTTVSVSTGSVHLAGALDSSNNLQKVGDSENQALRVNVVAGAAGGSTLITVRQSTVGDLRAAVYQSTATDLLVRAILPSTYGDHGLRILQSTAADLNVTVAGYSTTVNVSSLSGPVIARSSAANFLASVYQSTAADLNVTVAGYSTIATISTGSVRVHQSTAADLNVTVAGYSTTVNVSSLSGPVIVRSSAADAIVTVKNSTIGELLASVQQNSTVWQTQAKIQDSSAVGFIGTTTRPTTGAQGLVVRPVLNDLLSTCFSTMGNNSTSSTIVSSAASLRHKVYAYSITSTAQAVNTLSFASSLANPIWCVQMQSVSSGITGANLAVTPPAWLFATESASPLVFKITGTTGTYHLSFSYFTEA